MNTNPITGFFKTIGLFASGRVRYYPEDIGKELVMDDGYKFTVFRHVKILSNRKQKMQPEAKFIIRFKPERMGIKQNIKFSRLPMMIFMGFTGFREKHWMVNYKTGLCQGIYKWQTYEDAENYSKSIAVKFMTKRSAEGSVEYKIEKIET